MKLKINKVYNECEEWTSNEIYTLIDNLKMLAELKSKDEKEETEYNLRHTGIDDLYIKKI